MRDIDGWRDLRALPKAHLHLHLEGAMRPRTLRELASRCGVEVGALGPATTIEALRELYFATVRVLRTLPDLARLVEEVVEDAAQDGAVWLEPSFSTGPYSGTLVREAGGERELFAFVVATGQRAAARWGIGFGLMTSADRTAPAEYAEDLVRTVAPLRGGVVSFGLANTEVGYPPEPFETAFRMARDAGLIPAPHAGEHDGPDSIRGALHALGARRILHGIRAVQDPGLVAELAESDVCLDICPASNALLGARAGLVGEPLVELLGKGVRCSLNADNPLAVGVNILGEYERARDRLGLTGNQLADCAASSVTASGAPQELKAAALAGIENWRHSPAVVASVDRTNGVM